MREDAGGRILDTVAAWPGVALGEGRFGSTRILLGRRELGHLHGATTLDMPVPPAMKAALLAEGRARAHRFAPPQSGWISVDVRDDAGARGALALLRERYEHARARAAAAR